MRAIFGREIMKTSRFVDAAGGDRQPPYFVLPSSAFSAVSSSTPSWRRILP